MYKALVVVLSILYPVAYAEQTSDSQDYCRYVIEQAAAQHDLLRNPNLVGGVTQPETGLPAQALLGLTSSISNLRKAKFTTDMAQQECHLYAATTDAGQSLTNAIPSLERAALQHRIESIDLTIGKLDHLLERVRSMVDAHESTLPILYSLQQVKTRLVTDRAASMLRIASYPVSEASTLPLKALLAEKQDNEVATQRASERLLRQNDWDIVVTAGVHGQLDQFNSVNAASSGIENGLVGPYGTISFTLNLGRKQIHQHLSASTNGYIGWKEHQYGDVIQNAKLLRQQLGEALSTATDQVQALTQQRAMIDDQREKIKGVDTQQADDFRDRLEADRLVLEVEIEDSRFRAANLTKFLSYNF